VALQGLYQWLLAGDDAASIDAHLREQPGYAKCDQKHLDLLLQGCIREAAALDALLSSHVDRPTKDLSPVEHGVLLLGAFVGCFALWNLFGRPSQQPVSARWAWPAGLAGGVFSALFGTGGPLYTLYLARRIMDTSRLRATIGAVILGSAFVRLALFTGSGFFAQPGLLAMSLLLLPCAVLGYAVGSRIQSHLPQALVRRVIWMLLLASGASLLARGMVG
jgi:uncharacterized membrane protein YfcA